MAATPGVVSKGPILERLDRFCARRENVERLGRMLEEHPDPRFALDFAAGHGGHVDGAPLLSYAELAHVRAHWLPESGPSAGDLRAGWWPELRPLWPVLRRGLAHACRLALGHAAHPDVCPLDFYWVAAGTEVQVVACLGSEHRKPPWQEAPAMRQVTVLLMTPPPPVSRRAVPVDEGQVDWIYVVRGAGVAPGEHTPGPARDETVVVQPHWPAPLDERGS